jgi:uncharacterized membrane protein YfcA
MDVGTALGLVALAFGVGIYGTIIGAGGGFVMIPGLVLLFDLQGANAVGTGAVALMVIGLTGARSFDRSGLVVRPVAGWFALGSVPVALLAAWLLANRINAGAFNGILGALLVALGALVAIGPSLDQADGGEIPARPGPLSASGALVGLTSGTFAVGGGLITVPLLSRLQNLAPHRAAATTTATAMAASAAASIGHTVAGNVDWAKAGVLSLGAVTGALLGAQVAGRLSQRTVSVLLAVGLFSAGVPLLVEAA